MPQTSPDKAELLALTCAALEAELSTMTRAAVAARDAATHEEAKPENDKDTRGLEAAYLAGAQAERAAQLERELGILRSLPAKEFPPEAPIAIGALVQLDEEGREELLLVLPVAGGLRLDVAATSVRTVTTSSPLGAALVGARAGDTVELTTPRGRRECEISGVR